MYDIIVIGSGIGALAFASIMAQLGGRRVLILERHFKVGGFTHTFSRRGFTWDVGLHYVGEMGEGSMLRDLFDFITRSQVHWVKMPPVFERFVYPDLSVEMPDDPRRFEGDLVRRFPSEERAIRQYFHDVHSAARWYRRRMAATILPWPVADVLKGLDCVGQRGALVSTKAYLDARFRDPRLKGVLTSQWGDYGLPPSRSAFALHALIVEHYLRGGYYPEGGAGAIADAVLPVVREAGGGCLVNHEVTEILLEDGLARGVKVFRRRGKGGEEVCLFAPIIVSDAGAYTTLVRLLPEGLVERQTRVALESAACGGYSVVTLYLGLRESPVRLGFGGENHWLFEGYDHDVLFERRDELALGRAVTAYLSFPSLKNPQASAHTAEIIAPVSYKVFERWRTEPWRRRGLQYDALKSTIAEGLLELVERHYPGFRSLVCYQELSTPLTVEHFTGSPRGGIYGLPGTPERFRRGWLGPRTPVRNLLLTGSDAASPGVAGAMVGGVMTASCLLGPAGFPKILAAARTRTRRPY